jgi:excisionase family DNA binding protein
MALGQRIGNMKDAELMGPESRRLLSLPEVCEILGVGRTTVFELVRSGALPSLKIGRRRLVTRMSVENFIEGQAQS